jgi:hypothetical protein
MRKLAPMLIATTVAFAGAAFAVDTDKATGSPTVSPNTANPQGQSYTDKSNTAAGSNAPMDDQSKALADSQHDKKVMKKKAKKVKHDTTLDDRAVITAPADSSIAAAPAAPSAPVAGSKAATDNSTTGKTGQ